LPPQALGATQPTVNNALISCCTLETWINPTQLLDLDLATKINKKATGSRTSCTVPEI